MASIITLEQLRLEPDERGAIIGAAGCGKSFLASALMPDDGRLAIIDPKRMFKYAHDVRIFDNPNAILFWKPKRFIYRPAPKLLRDIGAYSAVYEYAYTRGKGLVYTDDVVGVMSRTRYPDFIQVVYQMGREINVSALASFQRPAWVPGFLMSEARKFYVFDFTLPSDLKKISEMVPGYTPEMVRKRYSFAFYETRVDMRSAVPVKLTLQR